MFDLRDKEHSTIIYECPHPDSPLLRLGWNKQDPRYMATIMMDAGKVRAKGSCAFAICADPPTGSCIRTHRNLCRSADRQLHSHPPSRAACVCFGSADPLRIL